MKKGFYNVLASALVAMRNCRDKAIPGRADEKHYASMADEWADYIAWIMKNHAPSGSGFDNGTTFDADKSDAYTLVFDTSFHHMDESGYIGWTEHAVKVRASHIGLDITVGARNRDANYRIAGEQRGADAKDYIAQVFSALADAQPGTLADYRARCEPITLDCLETVTHENQ